MEIKNILFKISDKYNIISRMYDSSLNLIKEYCGNVAISKVVEKDMNILIKYINYPGYIVLIDNIRIYFIVKNNSHIFIMGYINFVNNDVIITNFDDIINNIKEPYFSDFVEEIIFFYNNINNTITNINKFKFIFEVSDYNFNNINFNIDKPKDKNYDLINTYKKLKEIIYAINNKDYSIIKFLEDSFFIYDQNLSIQKYHSISNVSIIFKEIFEFNLNNIKFLSVINNFIKDIDSAKNIEDIIELERNIYMNFISMLYDITEKENNNNILVEQCKNVIHSNINAKLSVKFISSELKVNKDYLSRLFYKIQGISIKDYIYKEKIKISKYYIIFKDYTFGEISEYLSFSSQSHFIEIFKKYTGYTPHQFKNKEAKKYHTIK